MRFLKSLGVAAAMILSSSPALAVQYLVGGIATDQGVGGTVDPDFVLIYIAGFEIDATDGVFTLGSGITGFGGFGQAGSQNFGIGEFAIAAGDVRSLSVSLSQGVVTAFEIAVNRIFFDIATSGITVEGRVAFESGAAIAPGLYALAGNVGVFESNGDVTGATGIFADVPEPASWAMMTLGFGLVGAGLRMRRRTRAA